MDTWGFIILGVSLGVYYLLDKKKHPGWLFVGGIGAGIIIGAVWAYAIVLRLAP